MKPKNKKTGSKPGGRIHWLLMFLSKEFIKNYRLRLDYEYHNYHFMRYEKRTATDEFTIIRTSRKCFRVMYFNFETMYFEYFSEPTARECAEHIDELYKKIKRAEENKKC